MTIPNDDGFVGASVTEDQFKQNLVQLLDHIRSLTSGFDLKNGKVYDFASILDFEAIKTKIPAGSIVVIEWGEEYGAYVWDGTNLTKSQYDLLALAKSDATAKAATAKSEAISAAATDATTKANTAEANAKQAAQNTDVKLLTSIQQIIGAVAQFRNDHDVELMGLSALVNSNDTQTNTHIARLLVALQQLAYTITSNRDEIDAALVASANTAANNKAEVSSTLNAGLADLRSNFQNLFLALSTLIPTVNMLNDDVAVLADTSDEEPLKLSKLMNAQVFTSEMVKIDGFNPENASGGGKSVEIGSTVVLPIPTQAIRIDLETSQELPTSKGRTINTITTVNVDGQVFQSFGTIEVQGSSSAGFPKKNWTMAFFSDDTRADAINVKLGHMMPHDELVWKANFVDNTQTRNNVANRIWGEMVQSRKTFPKSEVDKVTIAGGVGLAHVPTGALGHVDGFPAVVYINNEFYGLGALNIGKKRGNYNLKSNNQKHIQIEPEGNVIINKLPATPTDPATPSGTSAAFDIRRPATWGDDAQASYTRFKNFLALSKADMIAAGVDNFIDRRTAIDYFILIQVLGLGDTFHKNTLYTTWDGLIWYFMPYDLDCTFGLNSNGKVEFSPTSLTIPNSDTTNSSTTDWWNNNFGTVYKLRSIYGADVDARYAELRKSVLSLDHLTDLHLQWAKAFTADMYAMENSKWNKGVDNLATSLIQSSSVWQIHDWISQHLPRCDTYFNYTAV